MGETDLTLLNTTSSHTDIITTNYTSSTYTFDGSPSETTYNYITEMPSVEQGPKIIKWRPAIVVPNTSENYINMMNSQSGVITVDKEGNLYKLDMYLNQIINYGSVGGVDYSDYTVAAELGNWWDSNTYNNLNPFQAGAYRDTQTISSLETMGPDLYFNKVKTREIFKVTPFSTTPVLHSTIGSGESDSAGYLTTIGIDNNSIIYGAVLKNPHLTTPDCKIEIWKIDSDGNALLFKTLEDKYLDDQGIDAIPHKRVSGITFDDDNNQYIIWWSYCKSNTLMSIKHTCGRTCS